VGLDHCEASTYHLWVQEGLNFLSVPAIVRNIWVLQRIGLYKTLTGMIAIEVVYGLAFAVLIFRNFIGTIPK